jgi:hypothetical protein
MSRTFSAAAIEQFFSPDSDDPLLLLVTIVSGGTTARFANGYTQRLTALELDESMTVYGVVSNGESYIFMPMELTLPSSEEGAAPRAQLTLHDATREAMPLVRAVTGAAEVTLQAVLATAPDVVEMSFSGLQLTGIHYNRDAITGTLSADNLAQEPFPAHAFVPSTFPGLF